MDDCLLEDMENGDGWDGSTFKVEVV
jgi:hypothetical protein